MHQLLRNHRSWILAVLFVAVIHVHQGQCGDRFFKKHFRNGKTDFVKTDGRTYNTRYEFGLDDTLYPGKLFNKLTFPTLFGETDKRSKRGKYVRQTSLEYCDSDEEEHVGEPSTTTEEPTTTTETTTTTKVTTTTEKSTTEAQPPSTTVANPVVGKSVCRPRSSKKPDIVQAVASTTEMSTDKQDSIVAQTEQSVEDAIDDSEELLGSSEANEDPPADDVPMVGNARSSSLGKTKLFKKLMNKPILVSVLKNFRVMLHVPIRFNRFQSKYAQDPIDQPIEPTEPSVQDEGEEEEDCEFIT